MEYKVIDIRIEAGLQVIDPLGAETITEILNKYAKDGWIVKYVYLWDYYLLEKRDPEFYFETPKAKEEIESYEELRKKTEFIKSLGLSW